MKKLTTLALVTMSTVGFLGAATAEKDTSACTTADCTNIVAQASTMQANTTMTADQQMFCNKLNSTSQQMFKSMDNDTRAMAMDMATSQDPNQAVADAAAQMNQKN